MANNCTACNKQLTFMENISNVLQGDYKRCKDCNKKFTAIQQNFLELIDQAVQRNMLTEEREKTLYLEVQQAALPKDLYDTVITEIRYRRNEIVQKELHNLIEEHFQAGTLTNDIEIYVNSKLPSLFPETANPISKRLQYLRNISEIQRGNVPRIGTSLHLDSDEYAHFDMRATYYKPNKKIKVVPGRLIGTNKKCYFISDSGADNATIDWNNVGQVYEKTEVVRTETKANGQTYVQHQNIPVLHVSVTKGSGGGGYAVADRYYTKILVDTLVRLWKRQLVIYAETKAKGAISEHVKVEVFRRDGGKCVQCGYEGPYIEYDHKYPRSKGGQNTVENIQLLCRMCNLKKGNRV